MSAFGAALRYRLALIIAFLARQTLRFLGRAATSMPGRLALFIDPKLLVKLCAGHKLILVTGTNGKTTTTMIIHKLLASQGQIVLSNASGANMADGLVSSLLSARQSLNKANCYLVLEIDEAWFAKLTPTLDPDCIVVTNFFRDQLDRYGELENTRNLILTGLKNAKPACSLVLCADDSMAVSLSTGHEAQSVFFGMDKAAMHTPTNTGNNECAHCLRCGTAYTYECSSYAHLGAFSCPTCGFQRPEPQLGFALVGEEADASQLKLITAHQTYTTKLSLAGRHNAYNATAALLAVLQFSNEMTSLLPQLARLKAASGRLERLKLKAGQELCLILAKNPVGLDECLHYIAAQDDIAALMFCLNDKSNDGRDISWIWDAQIEEFRQTLADCALSYYFSGKRAADFALRFYYAGLPEQAIYQDQNLAHVLEQALRHCSAGKTLYIVPNYTALLELKQVLHKY